jgi:hypothetical protein
MQAALYIARKCRPIVVLKNIRAPGSDDGGFVTKFLVGPIARVASALGESVEIVPSLALAL